MAKPRRGKYADIIDSLPKLPGNGKDAAKQVKIDAIKKEMIAEDPSILRANYCTEKYLETRLEKEAIEGVLDECQLRFDAICQLMADAYEVEATKSISLIDEPTVRIDYEPHSQVINKEESRLWCLKNGYEREMVLPWPTLNALTKKMLVDGQEEPEGVVAFQKYKIVRG